MAVYEALTVALIIVLATATIAALYLGLMNWVGAAHVVRCSTCHHLTVAAARQPQQSCPHCRHPVLMHPLYAVHHPRDAHQVRVTGDRLRY
jgi:DNA-directed RNA polymerase subunit RPC12/RpoP